MGNPKEVALVRGPIRGVDLFKIKCLTGVNPSVFSFSLSISFVFTNKLFFSSYYEGFSVFRTKDDRLTGFDGKR